MVLVGIMNICELVHWWFVDVMNDLDHWEGRETQKGNLQLLPDSLACQCQIVWNVTMHLISHNKSIPKMLSLRWDNEWVHFMEFDQYWNCPNFNFCVHRVAKQIGVLKFKYDKTQNGSTNGLKLMRPIYWGCHDPSNLRG